ncbi:MAG: helix-turn-helix domain-containing protein, partial [Methanomassiliicoccales archaeon]
MAGMFYSLEQAKEKLGKNEAEIKALVREGKLREFRDGAKQLYKTEDVDALASVPKGDAAILDDSMQLAIDETGEISLAPEELDMLMGDGEKDEKNESKFKLDETGALMADEVLDKEPAGDAKDDDFNLEILAGADTKTNQKSKTDSKASSKASSKLPADLDEEPLTNADTNISLSGDSINVLGGSSDIDFKISDDTLGETKLVPKPSKPLDDKGDDAMSVAKLDDDVNLDSFGGGSGSGLLDLSLQADDTSLGAVLDDIYPETQNAPAP